MREKKNWMKIAVFLGSVLVITFGMNGPAAAKGLPKTLAWTAYGTTSVGYALSVNIGNSLSEAGYKLRVIPGKNDISRLTPLKTGRVHFSAMGIGSYQAQEAVLDFGARSWGPQPVKLLMSCWGDDNTGAAACAADANIKKASDMKGKRIAWVVGAPALNQNMEGWLAYGGLTWDDVQKVTVPGWGASFQGIIDGNIDCAISSTPASKLYEVQGSPRGLSWFPAPAHEKENWKRMNAVAPWYSPHTATVGVGLSKENPLEGASYGYPILICYQNKMDDEAVYEMVKLVHTLFPKYKDGHKAAKGWDMKRQVFDWILPYHAGAVKYFKEIGAWNEKFETHNNALNERQKVLQDAWKKATAEKKDKEGWLEFWMAKRAAALKAAGMDPIWEK
jgi:TRAP transporter TAXI family solute receptor